MPFVLRPRWIPILRSRILVYTRPHATITATITTVVHNKQEPLRFKFKEEPLGIPASDGFGYYQGRPGNVLGPGDRFLIKAKLGYGMGSSVWLAEDQSLNRHVALKILTGRNTYLNQEGELRELKVLQHLSSPEPYSPYCIRLLDHFYEPGIDIEDGEHLCIATELMACDLAASIRQSDPEILITVAVIKRILRHLLFGLADIHARGIAHTDLKFDNIMIDLGNSWSNASIDSWLKDNLPQVYPPQQSLTKMVTGCVSQSLPPPSLDALASHTFKLGDFGSAQIVSDQTTDHITPLGLRPPEIILGGDWNESVDIWTFGCLAFRIITGKDPFKPLTVAGQSKEDTMLYQMICLCGEFFREDLLQQWSRSAQYFDHDCRPKPAENKKFFQKTFQRCILDCRVAISHDDVEGAATLLAKCLRLDPQNRATAQVLLRDPWLTS